MQEQYDGRDLEFVRQDLLQRIDDYNETARTWGASVCEGSLSMFLGKEARLSVAAALGAALAGMPQLSIAAAVPFLASLGQCALELRGKRRALGLELSKDPVSFVCDVKRRE